MKAIQRHKPEHFVPVFLSRNQHALTLPRSFGTEKVGTDNNHVPAFVIYTCMHLRQCGNMGQLITAERLLLWNPLFHPSRMTLTDYLLIWKEGMHLYLSFFRYAPYSNNRVFFSVWMVYILSYATNIFGSSGNMNLKESSLSITNQRVSCNSMLYVRNIY